MRCSRSCKKERENRRGICYIRRREAKKKKKKKKDRRKYLRAAVYAKISASALSPKRHARTLISRGYIKFASSRRDARSITAARARAHE